MTSLTYQTRQSAYLEALPKMNRQEKRVYEFLKQYGPAHAWTIANETKMLVTSVRRVLSDLDGKWVYQHSKTLGPMGSAVTVYGACEELPLFEDREGQIFFDPQVHTDHT